MVKEDMREVGKVKCITEVYGESIQVGHHMTDHLSSPEQQRLVRAAADHVQFIAVLGKLDRCDGRRVVIQRLHEAVILTDVKHVYEAVTAGRRQEVHA